MRWKDPKIDLREIHEPAEVGQDGRLISRLRDVYNFTMRESPFEHVCIKDTDVLWVNRDFYEIIQRIIELNPEYGIITCVTNCIDCEDQHAPELETFLRNKRKKNLGTATIDDYCYYSRWLFQKRKFQTRLVTKRKIGGFVMVTRKSVWRDVGEFPTGKDGQWGIDQQYCKNVREAGYPVLVATGLFAYHMRNRKHPSVFPKGITAYELSRQKKGKNPWQT